eukprot:jgi/Psemu1/52226/gm1.52226_g
MNSNTTLRPATLSDVPNFQYVKHVEFYTDSLSTISSPSTLSLPTSGSTSPSKPCSSCLCYQFASPYPQLPIASHCISSTDAGSPSLLSPPATTFWRHPQSHRSPRLIAIGVTSLLPTSSLPFFPEIYSLRSLPLPLQLHLHRIDSSIPPFSLQLQLHYIDRPLLPPSTIDTAPSDTAAALDCPIPLLHRIDCSSTSYPFPRYCGHAGTIPVPRLQKLTELSHFSLSVSPSTLPSMPTPTTPTEPHAGRSSVSSPKKHLQSTPSSSSAQSSGSRYPKRSHLKNQSSVTSMSVSSLDSSVASSTRSAKKPAPRPDSQQPVLKSPPLQPPALKQLVLTPSALQQPAPSAPTHPPLPAPAPALKQSLLQPSPSLTPSPSLDRQALRTQALAGANQAHSASFLWRFYGDGRFPTPSSIQHLRKSPAQTRVWNASPSPTHFSSKKNGRDKKSIHDVCRLSVAPVYALVNPDDSDWRSATVESLVSLASACFQGSAEWTKSPPGQALWKCLIGLTKMSPERFDDLYCEGNLMPSTERAVWLSANR